MTKLAVSIISLLIGLAIGFFAGYLLPGSRTPLTPVADAHHFYYHLNDSTIVRHTISGSGSTLSHKIDTLAVLTK